MITSSSYTRAVVTNNQNIGRRWTPRHTNPMGTISHSSVQLNISMEERTWLNNAWVGRLRNLVMFDRVEDELMWDRGEYITSKYLGDDMVLLLGLTDSKAEQLCKEATDNELSLFHKVKK